MTSTYVNDLRLNEMATGDQSGSWGTVTNTNLELIGEAFSYGAEAITTNANTHTTTIADGATDAGRSMYLKYTGALDSSCTITIGPNTVSKMWFIENATTGSQDIIISQGSGANVTIPAGKTKAVYSNGTGSGAAFVDAFDSLSVGALTADGGININNINIDGTTIGLSSGDLTIDVAGDIILDADGGDVFFKDGGVSVGLLNMANSDLTIKSEVSDKDIILQGNDGGSTITALTLDMSAAGAATFNSDVNAPNFNTTSDATLKTNVETLFGSLKAVTALRGVSFDWIESGDSEVGVIAQEVEAVIPQLVSTNDKGVKSVKYGNMVAVLIEAMKEQQAQIDALTAKLNG